MLKAQLSDDSVPNAAMRKFSGKLSMLPLYFLSEQSFCKLNQIVTVADVSMCQRLLFWHSQSVYSLSRGFGDDQTVHGCP